MTRALNAISSVPKTALATVLLTAALTPAWAHDGGLGNEVMWAVCEGKLTDDPCSFQNAHHDTYRGSCQSMVNRMICVRNQPIERASTAAHAHGEAGQTPPARSGGSKLGWLLAAAGVVVGALALSRRQGKPLKSTRH